jgi:hypothetical protein
MRARSVQVPLQGMRHRCVTVGAHTLAPGERRRASCVPCISCCSCAHSVTFMALVHRTQVNACTVGPSTAARNAAQVRNSRCTHTLAPGERRRASCVPCISCCSCAHSVTFLALAHRTQVNACTAAPSICARTAAQVRNSRCTHTCAGRAQTSELCAVYLVV